MSETAHREHYLADLESVQSADAPELLQQIRQVGASLFAEMPYPHHKQEMWRFTDVKPIIQTPFRLISKPGAAAQAQIDQRLYDEPSWTQLVFVDGFFDAKLSRTQTLPSGVVAGSLAQAIADGHPAIQHHLDRVVNRTNAFVSLNSAFLRDGLFVYVPKGIKLEAPIHALYVSTGGDTVAAYPRALVVLEEGAEADVIESFAGPESDATYFTNAVAEMVVGDGAHLRRHKIVEEGPGGYHLSTVNVVEGKASQFTSFVITLTGRIVRNELQVKLGGDGGRCELNGLYLNDGDRLIDNPLFVEHAACGTYSRMGYKGVLDGKSRSVFTGKVLVHPGAQQTDSNQINNNVLKSDEATIDTKPQLEIFADDVKCTHGATIGGFPREVLFYFQSRGMSDAKADAILTYGFASEVVDEIAIEPLHARLNAYVFDRYSPK